MSHDVPETLASILSEQFEQSISLGEMERRIQRRFQSIGWTVSKSTLSRLSTGSTKAVDWQKLLAIAWVLGLDIEQTNSLLRAANKTTDLAECYRIRDSAESLLFEPWSQQLEEYAHQKPRTPSSTATKPTSRRSAPFAITGIAVAVLALAWVGLTRPWPGDTSTDQAPLAPTAAQAPFGDRIAVANCHLVFDDVETTGSLLPLLTDIEGCDSLSGSYDIGTAGDNQPISSITAHCLLNLDRQPKAELWLQLADTQGWIRLSQEQRHFSRHTAEYDLYTQPNDTEPSTKIGYTDAKNHIIGFTLTGPIDTSEPDNEPFIAACRDQENYELGITTFISFDVAAP